MIGKIVKPETIRKIMRNQFKRDYPLRNKQGKNIKNTITNVLVFFL